MNAENSALRRKNKYFFNKGVSGYFSEFSEKTRTHYLHYIFDPTLSWSDRIYWLFFCCIFVVISFTLIIKSWHKWNQSAILTTFAEKPTPIWQIPFPAITICPETKVRQTQFNFTEYYHKILEHLQDPTASALTDEELQQFSDTSLICDNHLFREGPNFTTFDTINNLIKIAPPFDEVFFSCKWTSMNETCDNLFTPILTEDGICFTFNMLDKKEFFTELVSLPEGCMEQDRESEEWTLEKQYSKDAGKDAYPRRALSSGSKAGMFLLLRSYKQDLDYICRGPVQGFKVLLHHPAEIPRVATHYFRAPLNQEIVVSVQPNMITTSEELKSYKPHQRQCFFTEERQLQYFQIYTQQNCQVECITNYTLAKCGCVAYHMPRSKITKICGSGSTQCMFDAHQELLTREVESGISRFESEDFENLSTDCDCLPSCTSINYNTEISQADFNWPKVFEAFRANFSEFPGIQMTRLTLFFKDMQFTSSERKELHNSLDFLAVCGGLLALFTGFSLVTVVEIIYFLTLRLMRNKYNRYYSSKSKNIVNNDLSLSND